MSIEYESLKKKYFELFDGKLEYFDFIITDVLFAYKEISEIIKKQEIKRVLEVVKASPVAIAIYSIQVSERSAAMLPWRRLQS